MAKKQQSSKRKVVAFSVKGWNTAHYTHTEQYAKMVETLFRRAEADIVFGVANVNPDAGKVFSFDDYPGAKRMVAKTISELTANVTTVISKGSRKEWLFACQKNDAFLASILDTSKLTSKRLALMQDRNLDGLKAFQERKVDGMDLSKRVWKYTDQFKDQLELALDAGLGEGRSADQLSRDVRQNLKDPNRLFRRVRDKHGNLVLSKAAKAFHPGQGVYRSSYKNAMRLTRSEINMAYREADWQRWQQLDFVVGIEIHRSKNIKCDCPLCDRLAGKYPKQFKFKGWHPQCMCYVTPVLMDDETFNQNELADLKAAFRGTQAKHFQSKDAVTDVPDGFKEWVKNNVESQKYWKNTPYFVRDNFVSGDLSKGLKPLIEQIKVAEPKVDPIQMQIDALMPKINDVIARCRERGLNAFLLEDALAKKNITEINVAITTLEQRIKVCDQEWKKWIADAKNAVNESHKFGVDSAVLDAWLYIIESDQRAFIMDKGTCQRELQKVLEAIVQKKANSGDAIIQPKKPEYTYIADDSKMPKSERAANIFETLSHLIGTDENTPSDLYATYQFIKRWYANHPDDEWYQDAIIKQAKKLDCCVKAQVESMGHWDELAKATDLEKIPPMWRKEFNALVQEVDEMNLARVGYTTAFQKIEAAYNIYRLSTSKEITKMGLNKVSSKMPYQLVDVMAKKLKFDINTVLPKKEFFDSFEQFVPLSLTGNRGDGCYYSPKYKMVVIPINNSDTKTRFIGSSLYRTKIQYHEFGHAKDDLDSRGKWKSSKEWNDLFDKFAKVINADNGDALAEKIEKAFAEKGGYGMAENMQEEFGALSDTVQAMRNGHKRIRPMGHDVSYFRNRDKQLAEFIAHASENYWGGNSVFKELFPDLYDEMVELVKKYQKR